MKHIILTALLSLISVLGISQTNTAKAFFIEYDSDSKMYSFEEANGDYLSFDFVSKEVLTKFPINTSKLEGKAFLITFSKKITKDEYGDEYDELTITKLQEIKLEKESTDEEED